MAALQPVPDEGILPFKRRRYDKIRYGRRPEPRRSGDSQQGRINPLRLTRYSHGRRCLRNLVTNDPNDSGNAQAAPEERLAETALAPSLAVWARIKEHKVAQWTLVYAAAAYALLDSTKILIGRPQMHQNRQYPVWFRRN